MATAIPDRALRQFLVKNLARGADQSLHWRVGLGEITANYDAINQAVTSARPIANPTCFIRAGRSNFITDTDIAAIGPMFTNAEVATIADAGHWVHIDAAEEFYRVVTSFLLGET